MTRISQLNTLTTVTDSTTWPVVEGGTTKKVTLSTVKTAILRPATNAVPGVVKIGNGLNVTLDGTVSVDADADLPAATTLTLGAVRVGSGLTINEAGVLSATYAYTLPPATLATIGGVRADGVTTTVNGSGILSATQYSLPIATTGILGGIKVDGTTITINPITGVISGANTYLLPTATTSVLGGVRVDGTTITVDGNGIISGANTYSLPTATTSVLGGVKVDGSTIVINNGTISASAGGGTFIRTVVSNTTASIANNVKADITITGFKTYALYQIETSAAAWVRIYTDEASRTADASRAEGADPLPGSGVIAEVITTGADTILISPGTLGFNNEATPTSAIYCAVTNKSGATAAITVDLSVLGIEI